MEQTPSSPDIVQDINKKEDGSTYQERVSISNGQMVSLP